MADTKPNKDGTSKKSDGTTTKTPKAEKPLEKAQVGPKTSPKVNPKVSVSESPGENKSAAPKVETKAEEKKTQSPSSIEKPKKVDIVEKPKKGMIIIQQIASPIRRDPRQELYLKSLGLGKMNRKRQIVDNPSTRGLLDKLRHMVVIIEQ